MKTLEDYLLETMRSHFDNEDPCVGIFWYDSKNNKLFGVRKQIPKETKDFKHNKTHISCDNLHKYVWKKEFNKQKFKNNGIGPFKGDWKDTERGRIFYDVENDIYKIYVGSWIKDYNDAIDLIVDEFHLNQLALR